MPGCESDVAIRNASCAEDIAETYSDVAAAMWMSATNYGSSEGWRLDVGGAEKVQTEGIASGSRLAFQLV